MNSIGVIWRCSVFFLTTLILSNWTKARVEETFSNVLDVNCKVFMFHVEKNSNKIELKRRDTDFRDKNYWNQNEF